MTRLRRAQRLAIVFFALNAIALVFPGVLPFRGPEPFVFGMPFGMIWTSAWIIAAFFVLLYIDSAYRDTAPAPDDAES